MSYSVLSPSPKEGAECVVSDSVGLVAWMSEVSQLVLEPVHGTAVIPHEDKVLEEVWVGRSPRDQLPGGMLALGQCDTKERRDISFGVALFQLSLIWHFLPHLLGEARPSCPAVW